MSIRAEVPAESVLLEQEIAFYGRECDALAAEFPGRYLLIYGDSLIGDFATMEEATAEGVRKFGAGPFLARLAGERSSVTSLTTIF